MKRPVYAQWIAFRDAAIPKTAGAIQRECMRDAFYAGALSLFTAMNASVSEGDEIADADMGFMEALEADLSSYPEWRLTESA